MTKITNFMKNILTKIWKFNFFYISLQCWDTKTVNQSQH